MRLLPEEGAEDEARDAGRDVEELRPKTRHRLQLDNHKPNPS